MSNYEIAIIYTTVSSLDEGKKLAKKAVGLQLAKCVNIIPGALSIYEWQGKVEEADEYVLIFKTSLKNLHQFEQWLSSNHPYEVPAILKVNCQASERFYQYLSS
ncbi:MAG: CutA protein [Candidatus Midichloriaceae bacterium]|jgi:periplasmic divalent cation tolerance protein|nr:CutA protein [Candidatus Midichloriaceae bacterium]